MNASSKGWRLFFRAAAIYALGAAISFFAFYFYLPAWVFTPKGLPLVHNVVVDTLWLGTVCSVLLFGVGYYAVSIDRERNRIMIWLGAVGKIAFPVIVLRAYAADMVTPLVAVSVCGDLVWAAFFIVYLRLSSGNAPPPVAAA